MPTNVRALRRTRNRKAAITAEMIDLYARGREIIARGDDERWEDEGGRYGELLAISTRLNWSLLGRMPHEVSVFENLDGEPPGYMRARNSEQFPDFNGWRSGAEMQRRLEAALVIRASR